MYDGAPVDYVDEVKFLGVIVDRKLKFNLHLNAVCSKVAKSVGIFHKLRSCLPERVLLNLYYSLVYPYIIYCILIWGGTSQVHLRPLLLLQKKIVRIITGSEFLAHTDPLFFRTSILKLDDVYDYTLAQFMYKKVHDGDASVVPPRVHDYSTRNRSSIRTAFHRLTSTQQSVDFAGPRLWNNLPADVKESNSFAIFKRNMRADLLNKYNL